MGIFFPVWITKTMEELTPCPRIHLCELGGVKQIQVEEELSLSYFQNIHKGR